MDHTFAETADIETASDDYATRFAGSVGAWFLKVQEAATLDLLKPYPGASVLDVGGGHGQTTAALVRAGYKLTVTGSAPVCATRIQPFIAAGQVRFDVVDNLHLPYPDQSCDIVLSYRLLPHVDQWQRFLTELTRVARTAVIVDFPEINSVNKIAPWLFDMKKKMEGNTRTYLSFTRGQLVDFLAGQGFVYDQHRPEFFFPMVLHRKLKLTPVSAALEGAARAVGLTRALGSPVILKVTRATGGTR